ncbi:hypothetical protein PC118_g1272 [Phytophthora cactorum]|uniref:PH domain-containing protein n=1 Tax=Phytophthora cactorum TaxID=29920 RepID=A0A8T1GV87_9STRA|nr:hypothetical protein PC114_g1852 [Phytophthora cactorum]KAG2998520.1 hypothetical protein PC118_g1272 [Phytophthora cactorum]
MQRQRITLFSAEDADAMALRERSSTVLGSSRGPGRFDKRAQSYSMRPSMTVYGHEGEDYFDGSASYSSVTERSGTGSFAPNRTRLSVSPDLSSAFEDIFETDWEGYIWKQGHVVRSWRYRYAVLSGTTFSYYVSKDVAKMDTEKFRGRVTVTGASRDPNRSNGVLITTTINKIFAMYTRSSIECEIWVKMLQQAVQNASNQKPGQSFSGASNGRDSDLQSGRASQWNPAASGNLPFSASSILSQTVRSSGDWKARNLATIKQFYSMWTTQFLEQTGVDDSAANLISLFPICSPEMIVSVSYPCEFLPSTKFYGREGLVDVVLGFSRFVLFKRFAVSRYMTTKQPNVLQVLAAGTIWNKSLKREFTFTTRDEIQLSPGGRVLSLQMQIEVDIAAFQMSDAERKAAKAERAFQASTSKRVLSLSIQHFHVNRVLGARQTSDILTHPFFQDIRWNLVLRKKISPPWVPAPMTMEEERMKSPDINFDKYLASKTASTGNIFSIIFPWKHPRTRHRRARSEMDYDSFGKFSYVSDTSNSFLVDEDEMLDAAFTGRRSIQVHTLAGEA